MTKVFVGIDMSKKTFDVRIPSKDGGYSHKKIDNTPEGFAEFSSSIPLSACCVMEASGSYYLPLALHLYECKIEVCVVNPLSVNHFSKVILSRAKTDKKDAGMLAEYGRIMQPKPWKPKAQSMLVLQQLQAVLDSLIRQQTRFNNQLEAFQAAGTENLWLQELLSSELERIGILVRRIEAQMEECLAQDYKELLAKIQGIPGIGKRTAMMLILVTDGFTKFDNPKQLVSYLGLSPRIFESGTSVKARARICKMGMGRARALLYLCAMQAKRCNPQCKEMFDRLKSKGKNGKLIIIAIANKLARQAFAIGTGSTTYQAKFIQ